MIGEKKPLTPRMIGEKKTLTPQFIAVREEQNKMNKRFNGLRRINTCWFFIIKGNGKRLKPLQRALKISSYSPN